MMEFTSGGSNTKFIAITGVLFNVFPLSNIGSLLDDYPEYTSKNNRNIYS
jgi:hypothetical protein